MLSRPEKVIIKMFKKNFASVGLTTTCTLCVCYKGYCWLVGSSSNFAAQLLYMWSSLVEDQQSPVIVMRKSFYYLRKRKRKEENKKQKEKNVSARHYLLFCLLNYFHFYSNQLSPYKMFHVVHTPDAYIARGRSWI